MCSLSLLPHTQAKPVSSTVVLLLHCNPVLQGSREHADRNRLSKGFHNRSAPLTWMKKGFTAGLGAAALATSATR